MSFGDLRYRWCRMVILFTTAALMWIPEGFAQDPGEALFSTFLNYAKQGDASSLFEGLNKESRTLNWDNAKTVTLQGNLRRIQNEGDSVSRDGSAIYLVRSVKGDLFILSLPENPEHYAKGADSPYANIPKMLKEKMNYRLLVMDHDVNGEHYTFATLLEAPTVSLGDTVFRIAIVVAMFAVMLGMGMTLGPGDFLFVMKKPVGILTGLFCMFGIMPFITNVLCLSLGYDQSVPFLYVGMILAAATPGGAASNLMTHLAKGDVALSISLTAVGNLLSLFLTPLVLMIYCTGLPQIDMPVNLVILPILVLVFIPLIIGMAIKARWDEKAAASIPVFNIISIVAVIGCFGGGIVSNSEMFTNIFGKFGIGCFLVASLLVILNITIGGAVPKLFGVSNYQARAISLEAGIRNAILGMTIALLIQDRIGDYNSYMFAVSGFFAIMTYLFSPLVIYCQRKLLPVVD